MQQNKIKTIFPIIAKTKYHRYNILMNTQFCHYADKICQGGRVLPTFIIQKVAEKKQKVNNYQDHNTASKFNYHKLYLFSLFLVLQHSQQQNQAIYQIHTIQQRLYLTHVYYSFCMYTLTNISKMHYLIYYLILYKCMPMTMYQMHYIATSYAMLILCYQYNAHHKIQMDHIQNKNQKKRETLRPYLQQCKMITKIHQL
eukprot:TRINITY_DN59307_c0_g1_i2.p3 TRINITY_DN59307_c0_g1~~TRINITY_DN59307_c0_g1_i2.p3  ORF type:complete len:199 (+),score=-20.12 TRINITY_DN59307_c0_g1_i2:13-609(+)